jgi:hypothetical protein
LKAALDAAHGHAHHDDGTPVEGGHDEHEGDGHEAAHSTPRRGFTPLTTFFAGFSGLLLGLLYLSRTRETSA